MVGQIHQIKRFSMVGFFNTVLGIVLIFLFQAVTGSPVIGNFMGYLIGLPIGYVFHAKYSFRSRPSRRGLMRFVLVYALAYSLNLVVLGSAMIFVSPLISQCLAITCFVISSYILQSRFVFSSVA